MWVVPGDVPALFRSVRCPTIQCLQQRKSLNHQIHVMMQQFIVCCLEEATEQSLFLNVTYPPFFISVFISFSSLFPHLLQSKLSQGASQKPKSNPQQAPVAGKSLSRIRLIWSGDAPAEWPHLLKMSTVEIWWNMGPICCAVFWVSKHKEGQWASSCQASETQSFTHWDLLCSLVDYSSVSLKGGRSSAVSLLGSEKGGGAQWNSKIGSPPVLPRTMSI